MNAKGTSGLICAESVPAHVPRKRAPFVWTAERLAQAKRPEPTVIVSPGPAMHPLEYRPTLATGFVYGIQSLNLIKIGVAKNVAQRLDQIRAHNPHDPRLVFQRQTVAPYYYEGKMHELLSASAVGREWFRASLDEVKAAAKIAGPYARRIWKELADEYSAKLAIENRARAEKVLPPRSSPLPQRQGVAAKPFTPFNGDDEAYVSALACQNQRS